MRMHSLHTTDESSRVSSRDARIHTHTCTGVGTIQHERKKERDPSTLYDGMDERKTRRPVNVKRLLLDSQQQ